MRIPDEVIVDIISRLPVKDLVRFTCVSKPWLSLIASDSHFSDLHYSRSHSSNQSLVVLLQKGNSHSGTEEGRILYNYWFPLDSLHDPHTDLPEIYNPFHPNNAPPRRDAEILASCYGLLVLRQLHTHTLALLNPSTGKSNIVPPNPAGDKNVSFSGFGWDSYRHCFKLVTMIEPAPSDDVVDLMIYDVNGTWRKIQRQFDNIGRYFRRSISFSMSSPGVYVNDVLYWHHTHPEDEGEDSILIVGFNLKEEEFYRLESPYFFPDLVHMVAFEERLCLVWRREEFESEDGIERTDILVMDEKFDDDVSEERSFRWVILFSISDPRTRLNFSDDDDYVWLSPECYSACRNKVLFNLDVSTDGAMFTTLVWYDLETGEFEDFDNPLNDSCSPKVTTFKRSLIGNGMF